MSVGALIAQRQAIVFDLDGTLVDTLPDLVITLNEALAEHGLGPVPSGVVKASLHGGMERTVDEALRALGGYRRLRAGTLSAYVRRYGQAPARHSQAYDGVAEFLGHCTARGARLAVCTNKLQAHAETLLGQLGLRDHFDGVVGADTSSQRKPHPAPLLHALGLLRAAPHETVMVGDSPVDVACARAAAVDCVVFGAGYGAPAIDEDSVAGWFHGYRELLPTARLDRARR